jgi:putative transcriptional regulator
MQSHIALVEFIREVLSRSGYWVSDPSDVRPACFDVAARRDGQLILVKALLNIDALSRPVAQELRLVARLLEARALVVGAKSGVRQVEEGVVHDRYGVPVVAPRTFAAEMLHDEPAYVYAAPGGYLVRIDRSKLARIRQERNLSLAELAKSAGVNRRTLLTYEAGTNPPLEAALRLEEFLETELILPLDRHNPLLRQRAEEANEGDPLESTEGFEREVYQALCQLGYEVVQTRSTPFSAVSTQKRTLILTSIPREERRLETKARLIANLSRVTEHPGVLLVRRRPRRDQIEGAAVVSRDEVERAGGPEELVELIRERAKTERKA